MKSLLFSAVCFALDFHACLDSRFTCFHDSFGDMKFCTVLIFCFPRLPQASIARGVRFQKFSRPARPGERRCVTRHAPCAKVASQPGCKRKPEAGKDLPLSTRNCASEQEREPVHDNLCCDMFFQLVHFQLCCTCRSSLHVQVAHADSHVVNSTCVTFVGVV